MALLRSRCALAGEFIRPFGGRWVVHHHSSVGFRGCNAYISIWLGAYLGSVWEDSGSPPASADTPRPNIIVIMSDDMGYSDLGCYGERDRHAESRYPRPRTEFASHSSTTTPGAARPRASLLTGLYPHQAGIGHMMNDRGHDGYRGVLNRQSVTIAEALRPSGYRTYMCGKWHVTPVHRRAGRSSHLAARGADSTSFTVRSPERGASTTRHSLPAEQRDHGRERPEYKPDSYYYTDAISDNAGQIFATACDGIAQEPCSSSTWLIRRPTGRCTRLRRRSPSTRGGLTAAITEGREARLRRMKESGLVAANTQLTPGSDKWDDVEDKAWEARCKEVYAAMIDTMDAGIGRIVGQLKASGQLDNT